MSTSIRVGRWIAAATLVAVGSSWTHAHAEQMPQSLVYAVYDSETGAKQAFDAMKESQRAGAIQIDSFAVVSKDAKGKVHVQSTQKKGAKAGAIVGALIGVLGGPAGAAVGAAAGGGLGFLTGEAVGIPRETINNIKSSLTPGTSAVIAVIDERWVAELEDSLRRAQAKQVMNERLAAPSTSGTGGAPGSAPPSNSGK